jgi:hypothetical protein
MATFWNLRDTIANILAGTARAFVRKILSSSHFDNDLIARNSG